MTMNDDNGAHWNNIITHKEFVQNQSSSSYTHEWKLNFEWVKVFECRENVSFAFSENSCTHAWIFIWKFSWKLWHIQPISCLVAALLCSLTWRDAFASSWWFHMRIYRDSYDSTRALFALMLNPCLALECSWDCSYSDSVTSSIQRCHATVGKSDHLNCILLSTHRKCAWDTQHC